MAPVPGSMAEFEPTHAIDDGGPVYPAARVEPVTLTPDAHPAWVEKHYPGMSLRDYFAAQILPAVYARAMEIGCDSQDTIVAEAYELADTMLQARKDGRHGA